MPSAPARVVSAWIGALQATLDRVNKALGLPRSLRVLGLVRDCPILMALCAMGLVVISVLLLQ